MTISRKREKRLAALAIGAVVAGAGLAIAADPNASLRAIPTRPPSTQHKYVPPPRAITGRGTAADPLKYFIDKQGNRLPDYSYAGYGGGGVAIPDASTRVTVRPIPGDNTARIQAAIDYVASLPIQANGLRGAVLLDAGRFEVAGGLRIAASGVVLRGHGPNEGGTVLVATGVDRRTLITVAGTNDRFLNDRTYNAAAPAPAIPLAKEYFPVNASKLRLAKAGGIKVGDAVAIRRISSYDWIKAMGMDNLGGDRHAGSWHENERDLVWDRYVTAVDGDQITIDAPITYSIDPQYGGGTVATYTWPGRIEHVGVENIRCESPSSNPANPKDEDHSWMAVTMEDVRDAWVRQVTGVHFVSSIVSLWDTCSRVTVEDCRSFAPISENAGDRRNTFFTNGQQTFFQRCYSEEGRHDFAVGDCAAGPNVFLQCWSDRSLDDSGPIDSLAAGVLYDNVRIEGNELNLYNRTYRSQDAGWSAVSSMMWQCEASVINCESPPTAKNYCYGCWGDFAGSTGDWASTNDFVSPDSLYYGQLADRLGQDQLKKQELIRPDLGDTPTNRGAPEEDTRFHVEEARHSAPKMQDWTDEMAKRHPIPTDAGGAKVLEQAVPEIPKPAPIARQALALTNGWLTVGGKIFTGYRQDITWWNGGIRPEDVYESAKANTPNPTKWVPGRYGPGLTENLDQVTNDMVRDFSGAIEFHYGLWYDVRDADHQRVRRMDGDVLPPFYEMPFARSGQGQAWDGLSRYDLTKFNPFYWNRLHTFADLAQQKGLALINNHFFQHNILEAGAHWASSQWRSANNLNDTGFPEPPMYAGDKRVFVAEQFYDETNPVRREIFRNYIRHQLDVFGADTNVVHMTSAEFQGPTHFVAFWLDCIGEWEKETGKHPIIALSATKDVQDAILADPVRSKVVDVIDIQYWGGTGANAARGGINMAPRQAGGGGGGGNADANARSIRLYRTEYPGKAVMYRASSGWSDLIAGGSLAAAYIEDANLAKAIPAMKPLDLPGNPRGQWAIGEFAKGYLIYSTSGNVNINLAEAPGKFIPKYINMQNGQVQSEGPAVDGGGVVQIKMDGRAAVVWLTKQQ